MSSSRRDKSADKTQEDNRAVSLAPSGWRLLVFWEDALLNFPLPSTGDIQIGRGEDVTVSLEIPTISRNHASVRLGPEISVEDLGSSNGTRVRGEKLRPNERARLLPGEAFELGSATAIIQRAAPGHPAERARRLWTHSYFEGRLEEECMKSARHGTPTTVIRLHLDADCDSARINAALDRILRSEDILASYAPSELEVLLPDSPPERAETIRKALAAQLGDGPGRVAVGIASSPADGTVPETLFASACARIFPEERAPGAEVIVEDPEMRRLHDLVRRVAVGSISVVLVGETGVGKEIVARRIHAQSGRSAGPFLALNCAAFAETMLEAELFGYEKGAFTGAVRAKPGLIESADRGTLFLDEVGEMPPSTQAKLLRVLEDRKVMRMGELRPRSIDVRFIAATNRDLEADSAEGRFRRDLYFRLNGVSITIPPLRARPSEILPLARAFLLQAAQAAGRERAPRIGPGVNELLAAYHWPGNIRELKNMMDRAALLCDGEILPEHLPVEKMAARPLGTTHTNDSDPERARIIEALERCAGNQTLAAQLLGISRRTLQLRLDAYNIARPRKRPRG